MKKLVILALVLGMASLANAALTLVVDGEVVTDSTFNIVPSDVVRIGVWNDLAEAGQGMDNFLTIAGPGSWVGAADTGFPSPPGLGGTATDLGLNDLGNGPVDIMELNTGIASADLYGVGVISWADFHCDGTGDVVVDLLDFGFGALDSITIHQIPEPMTMALLGLGGLFLRRRK